MLTTDSSRIHGQTVGVAPGPPISPREAEILAALGERLTNAEMAARFHIGVRTVESHVSALLRKLGAADRHELAAIATARRGSPRLVAPPHLSVSVFGRDNDAIAIGQLLRESRLVTLHGPGGVGKTTLALAVAGHGALAPDRSCAYVDLARVSAASDVAPAFASALGVERDLHGSWTDRVIEAVGARTLLIVVDNAEHVVDAAAAVVSELLGRVKDITFLVTAREPLSIPGERLWPVEPLAVTDDQAIALFCDRARAVRADSVSTAGALDIARVICQRLDGLPLAIELAAAEVRARTVEDIVSLLDRPLALLAHGDRTEARHRTLRAVIDWSYDLLGADEQAVFDRLGVFVAGFSMSDARSLCADAIGDDEAEGIVIALVSRSLLRLRSGSSPARYDMLDTIRHYAFDHLDATGALEATRDRHAATVMASLTEAVGGLWGPDESQAVAWFDDVQADIVGAYRWLQARGAADDALDVAVHGFLFGWSHGRATLRELVVGAIAAIEAAETTTASPELLALACGAAAAAANTAGDSAEAKRLAEQGFAHAGRADDPCARLCHGAAADLALFSGDTNAAAEHYRAAAEGFRSVGVAAMAAYLDAASGLALTYGGRQTEARPLLERSLAAADTTGCPSARAFTRYAIAELVALEDASLARQHLSEAIDLAGSVSAAFVAGIAELSLATLDIRAGEPRAALAHYATLIDRWRLAGNWTQQWNTLRTLVFVFVDLERDRAAAELMAAIECEGAEPTWGNDAIDWAEARASISSRLEPSEVAEIAATPIHRGDVLAMAESHIADVEACPDG